MIRSLNLPGTPRVTSACRGIPLLFYPLGKSLGDTQCQSGRVWKISPPHIRPPDRLTRSKSLYELRYPGPQSERFQEQNSLAPAGNRTISPRSLKSYPVTLYRFLHPDTSTAQNINTFAASYLNTQGLNNLCLKSRQLRP